MKHFLRKLPIILLCAALLISTSFTALAVSIDEGTGGTIIGDGGQIDGDGGQTDGDGGTIIGDGGQTDGDGGQIDGDGGQTDGDGGQIDGDGGQTDGDGGQTNTSYAIVNGTLEIYAPMAIDNQLIDPNSYTEIDVCENGKITGGSINKKVTVLEGGKISGGVFENVVENSGTVSGGTFNAGLYNSGTVKGSDAASAPKILGYIENESTIKQPCTFGSDCLVFSNDGTIEVVAVVKGENKIFEYWAYMLDELNAIDSGADWYEQLGDDYYIVDADYRFDLCTRTFITRTPAPAIQWPTLSQTTAVYSTFLDELTLSANSDENGTFEWVDPEQMLEANVEYTLTYIPNDTVSYIYTDVSFEKTYTIASITPKSISDESVIVDPIAEQVYVARSIEPDVLIVDTKTGEMLSEGTDYSLSYSDNTNCGTATVQISGIADSRYTGSREVTFAIAKRDYVIDDGTLKIFSAMAIDDSIINPNSYSSIEVCENGDITACDTDKFVRVRTGKISGGTFGYEVYNLQGVISGGTFNAIVKSEGTISGGTFKDEVINNGAISDGTFNDYVQNLNIISGGTFNGELNNYGTVQGANAADAPELFGDITNNESYKILQPCTFGPNSTVSTNNGTIQIAATVNGASTVFEYGASILNKLNAITSGMNWYEQLGETFDRIDGEDVVDLLTRTYISRTPAPAIQWPTLSETSVAYGTTVGELTLSAYSDDNGVFEWYDPEFMPITGDGFILQYKPNTANDYDYSDMELEKAYSLTEVTPRALSNDNVSVSRISSVVFNGKSQKPKVTLTDKLFGSKLVKDTDYTLKYSNNKNPGTGKITITGIGLYGGTLTARFTIKTVEEALLDALKLKDILVDENGENAKYSVEVFETLDEDGNAANRYLAIVAEPDTELGEVDAVLTERRLTISAALVKSLKDNKFTKVSFTLNGVMLVWDVDSLPEDGAILTIAPVSDAELAEGFTAISETYRIKAEAYLPNEELGNKVLTDITKDTETLMVVFLADAPYETDETCEVGCLTMPEDTELDKTVSKCEFAEDELNEKAPKGYASAAVCSGSVTLVTTESKGE